MKAKILQGDVLEVLRTLDAESVQCCVTSPPYWGLRDYGVEGQLGIEATPEEFVLNLVEVFREVRRVLRKDGTCWVNLGDVYAHSGVCGGSSPCGPNKARETDARKQIPAGLKPKDLCGTPWRVALALQADGWWLRQDIIWYKPNPIPESVTDRCTKSHEYLFLLSKNGANPIVWQARDTMEWSYSPDLSQTVERIGSRDTEPTNIPARS